MPAASERLRFKRVIPDQSAPPEELVDVFWDESRQILVSQTSEGLQTLKAGRLLNNDTGLSSSADELLTQASRLHIVTQVTPANEAVLDLAALVSETLYITPTTSLAELTVNFPVPADCWVGQVKVILSSQAVALLYTSAEEGDVDCIGASLAALAANEAYSFQCIEITLEPILSRWLRLS